MMVSRDKMAEDAVKKQTCLQCRKRKVRCDGKITGCSNCSRLNFTCLFIASQHIPGAPSTNDAASTTNAYSTAGSSGTLPSSRNRYTIGGIERRRGLKACRPCRASKSRCSGGWPKCRNCEQRGLDCQYLPSKRKRNTIDAAQSLTQAKDPHYHTSSNLFPSSTENIPGIAQFVGSQDRQFQQSRLAAKPNPNLNFDLPGTKIFLESHVNAYFDYCNPIPQYNFVHKASFLRNFHHNKLDPLLLRCICGISSRFIQGSPSPGSRARQHDYVIQWMEEVEAHMWPRMTEMKIENLQILLLLICWYSVERKISKMWTSLAMAARIAYGMRLNHEITDSKPFILKEVRRRIMWSIFMLDKFFAGGFPELTLCNANTMYLNLPCETRNFELDIPIATSTLIPRLNSGVLEAGIDLMGHMCRLVKIRHEILEVTKQIITSKTNPYTERERIKSLDASLLSFSHSLPPHMRNSKRNLLARAYTSEITGYINLHTLWLQCHCDLYRLMIPGIRESVPEVIQREVPFDYAEECRQLCLRYAVDICRLWSDTLAECDMSRITDQSVGIYAYQCANILVWLWNLDSDDSLRDCLKIISAFLGWLADIYPVVAEVQSEINGFITSLDVVVDFFTTHSDGVFPRSLTETWRSSLKQQSTQVGQTTSKFSLLEFLQNENKSDFEEYPSGVGSPHGDPVDVDVRVDDDIRLEESARSADEIQTDNLASDFWSTSLDMDFDGYDVRVDPFSRMFDDWALVDP